MQTGLSSHAVGHGDDDTAYVAFARCFGCTLVLGEPVGAPHLIDDVVDSFLREHPRALFFQTSSAFAQRLHVRHGYRTTPIGIERMLDVSTWNTRGRRKQSIRSAVNGARNNGIAIAEDNELDLNTVSPAWWRTRRRRTLRFLVPPQRHRPLGARTFVAKDSAGDILGFVTFDALGEAGNIIGYTPSVSLASSRFRPGLWYAIVAAALEVFQREGVCSVNLGLAPLADGTFGNSVDDDNASLLLTTALRVLRVVGGAVYNFKGIEHAKARFEGSAQRSWLCHRGVLPWWSLFAVLWRTWRGPR